MLAESLRAQLAAIPGVQVRDLGVERCGIVTFTVDGQAPDSIRERLAARGINVWQSTPTGTLLDMQARELSALVRASVHYYNSEAELARFCAVLREMLA